MTARVLDSREMLGKNLVFETISIRVVVYLYFGIFWSAFHHLHVGMLRSVSRFVMKLLSDIGFHREVKMIFPFSIKP